jgi:hypothetical protein
MPPTSVFHGPKELAILAQSCEDSLLRGTKHEVHYPQNGGPNNWPVDEIKAKNKCLLDQMRNAGNIYAIFEAGKEADSQWMVRYVGERKSDGLRQRLTEHLIKKDARTGSKLGEVKNSVSEGKRIAVAFIKVEPEALRLYVEESIIARHKQALPWNNHG